MDRAVERAGGAVTLARVLVSAAVLTSALLAGCGQKGPLYLPDEGIRSEAVPRSGAPAAPAPTTAPPGAPAPDGAPGPGTGAGAAGETGAPVTTIPDRRNEPRKRITP